LSRALRRTAMDEEPPREFVQMPIVARYQEPSWDSSRRLSSRPATGGVGVANQVRTVGIVLELKKSGPDRRQELTDRTTKPFGERCNWNADPCFLCKWVGRSFRDR